MSTMELRVTDQEIEVTVPVTLVSGSQNVYTCRFTFDDSWDGYDKTAVFLRRAVTSGAYVITNNAVNIPASALSDVDAVDNALKIGVYGVKGSVRKPTVYTPWLTVEKGASAAGIMPAPTEDQYDAIIEAINEGKLSNVDPTLTVSGGAADAEVVGDLFEKTVLRRGALSASVTPDNISETGYYVSPQSQTAAYTGVSEYAVFLNFRTEAGAALEQAFITATGRVFVRYGNTGSFSQNIDATLSHAGKAADAYAVGNMLSQALVRRGSLSAEVTPDNISETGYYVSAPSQTKLYTGAQAYAVFLNFRTEAGAAFEQAFVTINGQMFVRYGQSGEFIQFVNKYNGRLVYSASPAATAGAQDSTGGAFVLYIPYGGEKHIRVKFIHGTRADYDGTGTPDYHNENVFRLCEGIIGSLNGGSFTAQTRALEDGAWEAAVYKDNRGSAVGTYHGWEKFTKCTVIADGNVVGDFAPGSVAIPEIGLTEAKTIEVFYRSEIYERPQSGVTTETKLIDAYRHYVINEDGVYIEQENTWAVSGKHGIHVGMGNVYKYTTDKLICDWDNKVYDVSGENVTPLSGVENAKNNVSWATEYGDDSGVSVSLEVDPPCQFYVNNAVPTANVNKLYFKYIKDTKAGETWFNRAWHTFGGSRADRAENRMVKRIDAEKAYGAYITETAQGSTVMFSDGADDVPVKELIVGIDPVQQGSGTPDVTNPRLFSPVTEAEITHGGENLLNNKWYITSVTQADVTLSKSGDDFVIDGANTSTSGMNFYIKRYDTPSSFSLPAGTYTLSGLRAGTNLRLSLYNRFGNANSLITYTDNNNLTRTFTLSERTDNCFLVIVVGSGVTADNEHVRPMISWDSEASFETYSVTENVPFGAGAGDVYGGTLNVTTGELTVTHMFIEFNGSEDWVRGGTNDGETPYYYRILRTDGNGVDRSGLFSLLPYAALSAANDRIGAMVYKYENSVRIMCRFADMPDTQAGFKSFLSELKTAETPLQAVYPLSAPITYRISENEVKTLLGGNNISADTGDVSVTYRADTGLYIASQLQ